ncbi:hypothetical protein B0H16DRAFT_1474502 [Mycena metata]|uniref:Uncharacterized protein n=1 Tax=Mycena metata TaxID=1033252 RepID=A0AAD7HHZ0_9AGAR|nr:hypothetical protein B0H16DRAFT_1474502 [Mycena metata]
MFAYLTVSEWKQGISSIWTLAGHSCGVELSPPQYLELACLWYGRERWLVLACVTCHKPVWRANWLVMACGNNNVKKIEPRLDLWGSAWNGPDTLHLFPWLYPQLRRQRFQETEKSTKRYKDLYPPDMG